MYGPTASPLLGVSDRSLEPKASKNVRHQVAVPTQPSGLPFSGAQLWRQSTISRRDLAGWGLARSQKLALYEPAEPLWLAVWNLTEIAMDFRYPV
jgi:hypothetical protein